MKAILHYNAGKTVRSALEATRPDWLDVAIVSEHDHASLARELPDAEVLLHVLEPATMAIIAAASRLRLIQKIGVGVNTIDLDAARARGVAVCNMPGTNTQAVAEMTLLLILATLRRLVRLDRETRAGRGWSGGPELLDDLGEVAGRTVGLVGYGAVPRHLAPVLSALGARVICHARRAVDDGNAAQVPIDELFRTADVVSLHLPLVDETAGLVDAKRIASMKPGAVLVNTARGGLVDEAALVAGLRSGHLAGAGLDVFALEPAEAANPLLALPNVIVTPHVAWLTQETLERSIGVALDNCRRLRDGAPLVNEVAIPNNGR